MKPTNTLTLTLVCLALCQYTLSMVRLVSHTPTKQARKLDIDDIENDPISINMKATQIKLEHMNEDLDHDRELMRQGRVDNFEIFDKALNILNQKASLTPVDKFLNNHFGSGDEDHEDEDNEVD